MLLSKQSFAGRMATRASSASCRRAVRPIQAVRRVASSRKASVQTQAFLNFFQAKPSAGGAPSGPDPRAKELAADLAKLCSGTDYGSKATPQRKEAIANAVAELSKYCIKNPLKSPLLWGEYEVLYSSKPSAVGGPLRQGPGPAVFPGQDARQILEAPNKLINQVDFKTLGFVPGYSKQFGEIQPISADTFVLNITSGELKTGLGGPQQKEFKIQRKIQILYLDEELRVARFLPSADLEDDEAGGKRSNEEIIFVFQRAGVKRAAKAAAKKVVEEEDEEEEEAPKPKSGTSFIFANRKVESVATQAERQVRAQMAAKSGTAKVAAPAAKEAPKVGTSRVAAKPAPPAPKAAPVPTGTTRSRSDVPASVTSRIGTARVGPVPTGTSRSAAPPAATTSTRGRAAPAPPAPATTRSSAVVSRRGAPAKPEPEVEDPRERRRREQEAAAAARVKAAEEAKAAKAAEEAKKAKAAEEAKKVAEARAAKERAEAEKKAAAEKAGAIKELLAKLSDDLKARTNEARSAAAEIKDIEKSSGAVLKQVAGARAGVESAEKEAAEVSQKLGEATNARKDAEKALKDALAGLAEAEKALKAKMAEALPAISRK